MDNTQLLASAIVLLYHESRLPDSDSSAEFLKGLVSNIKLADVAAELEDRWMGLSNLRSTALQMCNDPRGTTYDSGTLLQRLRLNLLKDQSLYAVFEDSIKVLNEDETKQRCITLRKEFKEFELQEKITSIIRDAGRRVVFERESVDWKDLCRELTESLGVYGANTGAEDVAGIVTKVNFSDVDSVTGAVVRAKEITSNEGTLKLGWQSINRMTGEHNGLRRGEFVVVGALQHKNKSGFTLSMFKDIAAQNKPYLFDKKKKPMILHFTAENEAELNTVLLYKQYFEQEYQTECDHINTPVGEIGKYISGKFTVNGWHAEMIRINPTDFTYHDFIDIVSSYEAQGYEIACIVFDYLNMISKRGCVGTSGGEIRDLFRRVRNYTAPRLITFVTPHQLSPDAKMILRQSPDNFVKEIVGKGYWDGCKAIDQEVDLELIIHIEKIDGVSYQVVGRGKHRKVGITADEEQHYYIPFEKIGGLVPDIGVQDRAVRSVKHGGGDAWW